MRSKGYVLCGDMGHTFDDCIDGHVVWFGFGGEVESLLLVVGKKKAVGFCTFLCTFWWNVLEGSALMAAEPVLFFSLTKEAKKGIKGS